MKKFKYLFMFISVNTESKFNKLGNEGWEFIFKKSEFTYVFKKEINE